MALCWSPRFSVFPDDYFHEIQAATNPLLALPTARARYLRQAKACTPTLYHLALNCSRLTLLAP